MLLFGNNLENAFQVSDTVNKFMNSNSDSDSAALLNEENYEDRNIINNKFKNRSDNSNNFTDTASSNNSISNTQLQLTLQSILIKLDNIENNINHNKSRNMYDISLYILIGMIISFLLYSIFSSMKK